MTQEKLSERQRAIMSFIGERIDTTGFPPTIRDIGDACKIGSTSVVNYNLNKLTDWGFITRVRGKSRGLRLTRQGLALVGMPVRVTINSAFSVPMAGRIGASAPALHLGDDFGYNTDDVVEVPQALIGNSDSTQLYALTVSGQSMIDAMISDGDIVILTRQSVARNGDMVAALLTDRNETTLKHFYDEGDRIRLQPANPSMEPIYVPKDQIEIQGRVLAVMRKIA